MAWQKREKMPPGTGRRKRYGMAEERKNAAWDRKELIRRSLDIFSSEKMRDDSMGGWLRAIEG